MASMSGTPLPRMTPGPGGPGRILTAVQRRRRTARQAAGVADTRRATPEQVAHLRAIGALPGSGEGPGTQGGVLALVQQRRQGRTLDPASGVPFSNVPPGTPHAVQQQMVGQGGRSFALPAPKGPKPRALRIRP